jgi:hypothetical protein
MLARVVVRGRRIRMINRILIGLAVGGGAAIGAVGIGLGYSGALSFSRGAEASVTTGALTYYACPSLGAVGQFHAGDRVYVTGIDETGEWVQVRAPHDLDDRAWVQREYVDPDEDFEAPLATCNAEVGELALAEGPTSTTTTTEPTDEAPGEVDEPEPTTTTAPSTTTTTTTIAAPTTTTTSPPATTTTTAAPTTTTTTTAPTTTTTTAPAPVIGAINRSPATLREVDATPPANECSSNPGDATTSVISASITNAVSATMSWSVGTSSGSKPMSAQGGTFSAVLGPFGETTIPASPGTATIQVTITAVGPGGQRVAQTTLTLNHCEPFG